MLIIIYIKGLPLGGCALNRAALWRQLPGVSWLLGLEPAIRIKRVSLPGNIGCTLTASSYSVCTI